MGRRRRRHAVAGSLALVATALSACAAEDEGGPLVDRVDDAIFAVESHYQAPQDFFEISATDEIVSVIVAVDDATEAEQAFWTVDEGLVDPVPLGPMDRPTFRSGDLDFDPGDVLDQLRAELPDSEIVDFAITGAGEGGVLYDARLQSEQGGVLLVLLSGDGRILGVQAQ